MVELEPVLCENNDAKRVLAGGIGHCTCLNHAVEQLES